MKSVVYKHYFDKAIEVELRNREPWPKGCIGRLGCPDRSLDSIPARGFIISP